MFMFYLLEAWTLFTTGQCQTCIYTYNLLQATEFLLDIHVHVYEVSIWNCFHIKVSNPVLSMNASPCHQGMARPKVADRGTASNIEGICE
jgi:hypothetical protein